MENFNDMKITIGSDHRGYELKEAIKTFFDVSWIDVGTDSTERVDYPDFAHKITTLLLDKKADRGILICGSGIGMSIAANRYKGIYAALCWSPEIALCAREHDNSNVLILASDFISTNSAKKIVEVWLHADFLGGRYQTRLEKVDRNF